MEPLESVFMDAAPKLESCSLSVTTCRFCLVPESALRLTRRDLTAFYLALRGCGLGFHESGNNGGNWVCPYCWVRASQCVKFIESAREAEHILNVVFKHEHITEEKLTAACSSYIRSPVALSVCPRLDASVSLGVVVRPRRRKRRVTSSESEREASAAENEQEAVPAVDPPRLCGVEIETDEKPVCEVKIKKLEKTAISRRKEPNQPKKARRDPDELVARWRRLEVEVVKLSEEQQRQELEARRRSERYLQWRHKCARCAVGFHEEVSLRRHEMAHDESRGPYECRICYVRFAKQHQLSSHSGGHKRRWRCLRCGETILKNDYLEAHRAKCTGSPPLRCDACGKFFSNKLRLRQHVSAAHNSKRKHICDVCGRGFKAKHHIRYHMRIHTGEMPYQCDICGKKSSTSTSHRIHMTVHNKKTENPEAYCVECNKYFKNKNILQIHYQRSLKHNTKDSFPHACSECPERYPAAAALRIHMNSVHLKTRAYRCSLCEKAYYSAGTLAVHVKEKHLGGEKTRDHPCPVCKRAFITGSQLKAHSRVHTKERPYACPLCPATFTFNSGLYTHTRGRHKLPTAELRARLGLAALGTPQTQEQQLARQRELARQQELAQQHELSGQQEGLPGTLDALGCTVGRL